MSSSFRTDLGTSYEAEVGPSPAPSQQDQLDDAAAESESVHYRIPRLLG